VAGWARSVRLRVACGRLLCWARSLRGRLWPAARSVRLRVACGRLLCWARRSQLLWIRAELARRARPDRVIIHVMFIYTGIALPPVLVIVVAL